MSKITISDLAIDRDDESFEQLTEQEVNGIFGGLEITVSVTIKF